MSAQNFAAYLISFPEKVDYGECGSLETGTRFLEGRRHYSYVRMLQKQKVQLTNQLENCCISILVKSLCIAAMAYRRGC